MDTRVAKDLAQKEPSEFHTAILNHCLQLVRMSRSKMSKFYDDWDRRDETYRGIVKQDKEDKKANEKGAPGKVAIPLTYSQVQTFVAFCFSLYYQREHFWELEGTGEEDHRAAKLGEALLDRDAEFNCFVQKVYQLLLDIARFNVGVIKHTWYKETEMQWVKQETPTNPLNILGRIFGGQPASSEVQEEITKFLGNKLFNISPYRFFPDVRLPLTRFQEGEFCASEDEYSWSQLKKDEQSGLYSGIDHIPPMRNTDYEKRGRSRFSKDVVTGEMQKPDQSKSNVIVTEVQVNLIPANFKVQGKPMGPEKFPIKYVVCIANDSRVIKCEPLGYAHNKFTYDLAQFSPDQHELLNESLSDMISQMQTVIDWLINSHITNVRKHISNRLVVDPSGVEFSDIQEHRPVIRLKANASKSGVDRWVKQLNVSDVTRNHISDVQVLIRFVQMVTSISDNLMGQYNTGRRSAREAGNVAAAAGNRLKMVAKLIYDTCFRPLGDKMISNLRDGLDEETFITVRGESFPDWEAYAGFKHSDGRVSLGVDRTKISGRFDFKVFEGTLPSEKADLAMTLEQTLLEMMKSPFGVQVMTGVLGYDPKKLFKEVLELRGVKHPERFMIDQARMAELQQSQALQNAIPNRSRGNAGGGPANGSPGQSGGGVIAPSTGNVPSTVPQ
jgi:hypothetical protein